jgi:hypothetical protein
VFAGIVKLVSIVSAVVPVTEPVPFVINLRVKSKALLTAVLLGATVVDAVKLSSIIVLFFQSSLEVS